MSNNLISVIVPIFKVEQYLERCLKSLTTQSYSNLQIILVDDGSPDYCSNLCDTWIMNDNKIIVIHKPNGGLSDARNIGIPLATGTFISFIDSDDYVSDDFFEVLLSSMLKEQSDIVECGVARFFENNKFEDYEDDYRIYSYHTEKALSGLIAENPFHQHVWNKLYKTELIQNSLFPFGKLNEDEFWTYQIFGRAKIVTKINKTMYFYFQRCSSIMGEGFNIRRLDALEGKGNRQRYIETNYPELFTQAKIDFFASCVFFAQMTFKYLKKEEKKKAIRIIKLYVNSCRLSRTEMNSIHGKNGFWFKFADRNFWLCCKVRAIIGIGF